MRRFQMRSVSLVLATLLSTALLATSAQANDVTNIIVPLLGGTNYFGAVHTDSFDFTDKFTFSIEGSVIASMSLTTIGSNGNNIDFISAELNDVPVTFSASGFFFETGSLGDTRLTGPLVLIVRGKSGATGGTFASYAGTLNATVVPEPSTALLMGLGLGGLGLATRRARA